MVQAGIEKQKNIKVLTGNHAVSYAVKFSKVKVISAYPITPQTSIIEKLSEFVESGELDAKIIRVESEHSALAAVYGAAVGGLRSFTATSSHGLLYMHEWVHWFSRARIPTVMAVVSRTIGGPWNIWPDHSDFVDQRDTGWIMSFGMDNQEVFDLVIQAFKISEDPRVFLPVMVGLEGFILGGTSMPVELPEEKLVDTFLGPRRQPYTINISEPIGVGNLAYPDDTEEMFMDIQNAMIRAIQVIREVDKEFEKEFGRGYGGLTACYNCSDAKYLVVTMGAWSGDAIEAINQLRDEGYSIGLLRVRYMRPMPYEDYRNALSGKRLTIVFDRSISYGSTGPIYQDVISSIMGTRSSSQTKINNVIAGIGGVDMTSEDFYKVIKQQILDFEENKDHGNVVWYHKGVMRYYYG